MPVVKIAYIAASCGTCGSHVEWTTDSPAVQVCDCATTPLMAGPTGLLGKFRPETLVVTYDETATFDDEPPPAA